jgi:hypothetical protein
LTITRRALCRLDLIASRISTRACLAPWRGGIRLTSVEKLQRLSKKLY